jgi:hypothetical protein
MGVFQLFMSSFKPLTLSMNSFTLQQNDVRLWGPRDYFLRWDVFDSGKKAASQGLAIGGPGGSAVLSFAALSSELRLGAVLLRSAT